MNDWRKTLDNMSELLDELFCEAETPEEFDKSLLEAGFPFVRSDKADNEEWKAFMDKYPFSDNAHAKLGFMPGFYEIAWMVALT